MGEVSFFCHPSDPDALSRLSQPWRFIAAVQGLSYPRRFGTVPVLRDQTTADHTGRSVLWGLQLTGELQLSRDLRMAVVIELAKHDLHEAITGDSIWPTKNFSDVLKKGFDELESYVDSRIFEGLGHFNMEEHLNLQCKLLVVLVDCMDCAVFCSNEVQMGNLHLRPIMAKCVSSMDQIIYLYHNHFGQGPLHLKDRHGIVGAIYTRCKMQLEEA